MDRNKLSKAVQFLVLLMLQSWLTTPEANCADLTEKIRPAVVAVFVYNDNSELIESGNGFFTTADGHLLSSRHLFRQASRAEVHTSNGDAFPITAVLSEDSNIDVIELLVDLKGTTSHYLRLAHTIPNQGERVIALGHQHIVHAFASFVRAHSDLRGDFLLSSASDARATGGPVINSNGEVIAIATEQIVESRTLPVGIVTNQILSMPSHSPVNIGEWNKKTAEPAGSTSIGLFFAGMERLLKDDYPGALVLLKQAARQDSRDAEVNFYCGFASARSKLYDDAIEHYLKAARIESDWVDPLNNLGTAYHAVGRLEEAIESYKKAIKVSPNFAAAYVNLAAVLDSLGRYQESADIYKQAIKLRPNSAALYNRIGVAYYKTGHVPEALESFDKAVRQQPDFAEALNNLGVVNNDLGRDEKAAEALRKAITVKPEFAEACNNLGLLLSKQRQHREAMEYFNKAIALSPDFAEAQYNLGIALMMLGEDQAAFEAYGKLKPLNQKLAAELFNHLQKQYTVSATSSTTTDNAFTPLDRSGIQAPIKSLIEKVTSLVSAGDLSRDRAASLIAQLKIAAKEAAPDNAIVRSNLLHRFAESLSGLIDAKEISFEQAQPLIDAANGIADRLQE